VNELGLSLAETTRRLEVTAAAIASTLRGTRPKYN